MNRPLVSIISPVYNVERYIPEYLYSILNQTYQNLEIICVNDGSTDCGGEILDRYAEKDARILVIHQKNSGYPSAINRGLDSATGEYVGFVDPDDWVELNFYEKAVSLAIKTNADIVVTNFFRDYANKSEKMENSKPIPEVFEDKNAAFRYGFEADAYRGFKMYLWNKLFSSRFFLANESGGLGFRMTPELSTGGDSLLSSVCFLATDRFAYTSDAYYHYRIREASLMRSGEFSCRIGFSEALERIAEMLMQNLLDESVINLVKRFHTYYCSQLAEFAYSAGDKKNLELSKSLTKKYLENYIALSVNYPCRIYRINQILELDC